jgi:cytochrome c biogenesis protein CcmG, thiol:disulfide interchange protein DsbE
MNSPDDLTLPVDIEPNSTTDDKRPSQSTWRSPGRRRKLAIAGGLGVIGLLTAAVWQAATQPNSSTASPLVGRTGKPAPSFTLASLSPSGRALSLGSFRGRPLVINFWASWCIPCRTEMPLLEKAYRSEAGKVQFLGIDSNDTANAARSFVRQVGVTYPVVSDGSGGEATQYGLFGLPTTVLISPSGKIVGRVIGQLHASTLQAALKEAFHV